MGVGVGVGVGVGALLYILKWSMSSAVALPSLILAMFACGLVERLRPRSRPASRWLLGAGFFLIVAFPCRQPDLRGLFFPRGDALLQGHGLWRLFAGIALLCSSLHFRPEKDY